MNKLQSPRGRIKGYAPGHFTILISSKKEKELIEYKE